MFNLKEPEFIVPALKILRIKIIVYFKSNL